jgi:hypothetical protein
MSQHNSQSGAVLTFHIRIILRLPAEVLISIFTQLPNLFDVRSLAAASRHLRLVYTENAKPIYDEVAPRTFSFERRARQLLADGGGPDLGQRLALMNLATMFRNWRIVTTAMTRFELETKGNMKSK